MKQLRADEFRFQVVRPGVCCLVPPVGNQPQRGSDRASAVKGFLEGVVPVTLDQAREVIQVNAGGDVTLVAQGLLELINLTVWQRAFYGILCGGTGNLAQLPDDERAHCVAKDTQGFVQCDPIGAAHGGHYGALLWKMPEFEITGFETWGGICLVAAG